MNPYISRLLSLCEAKYSIDSLSMPYSEWISTNTRIKGRPFGYKGYEFQRALCDDMHPNLDVIKPSQTGLTEVQARKMLAFLVRNQGTTGIFSLPNEKMYKKFSKSRLKPIVDENGVFQSAQSKQQARSMELMQFNRSFLHVVNTTEGEATSTSADVVFNDEVDLSNQQMLALFNSRLQNSDWKLRQRFSTPTFTGFGVDLGYSASDQREYMVRCDSCNHWQIPRFTRDFVNLPGLPDDIEDLSHIDDSLYQTLDLSNAYVGCEKCHRALDLRDPELREWVATYPSRTNQRGYRVRPFSTDRIPINYILDQLMEYKRLDFVRGWFNTVLGEPYTDGSVRLNTTDIMANMQGEVTPEIGRDQPAWVGIDMGQTCHIVIGVGSSMDNCTIVRFEAVNVDDIQDRVKSILSEFNVIAGAVDRHPYTPTAEEIWHISDGRIWPVEYRGQLDTKPVKSPEGDIIYWQANRTILLDEVAKRIRRRKLPMYGYGHYDQVIVQHLRDMVRDEKPEQPANWIKLNGNDHYFHAIGFLLTAIRIKGHQDNMDTSESRVAVGAMGADQYTGSPILGVERNRSSQLIGPARASGGRIIERW